MTSPPRFPAKSYADPAEYLPLLNDRVRTLSSLVDDLFELARIDAGVLTVHVQKSDLGA